MTLRDDAATGCPYYAAPTWNDGADVLPDFQADFWHGAALAVLASIDTFCGYTSSQCGHCARSIVFVRAHFRALDGTRRRSFIHVVGTDI